MVGAIPHPQWLQILSASQILFMPSMYEGISVALYEAMAVGVVPVISAVGGQAELISPDCGVLVPLGEGEIGNYAERSTSADRKPGQTSGYVTRPVASVALSTSPWIGPSTN